MIVVDGMTVVVIMATVMVEMMAVMGMMVVEVKGLGLRVGVVVIAVMGSYGGGTCDGCVWMVIVSHQRNPPPLYTLLFILGLTDIAPGPLWPLAWSAALGVCTTAHLVLVGF